MAKKCLISENTENLNTSVTVQCSLGPITVCICDDELDKTLTEVSEAVTKLVTQAEELAETFGFDLEEAIAKGGLMTIGGPEKTPATPAARAAVPAPQTMRMQEIPQRVSEDEEMEEEASEGFPEEGEVQAVAVVPPAQVSVAPPIVESVTPGEKIQVKQRIKSPNGRQFELPERTVDETGETIIAIDTASEQRFNDNWEKMKREGKNNGAVDQSYGDSYSVQFMPCKLCMKGGSPTGKVSGQTCPKCKGAGEITVSR